MGVNSRPLAHYEGFSTYGLCKAYVAKIASIFSSVYFNLTRRNKSEEVKK